MAALPLPTKRLLTGEQAAQYLGLKSVSSLRAHVRIAPVQIGSSVRYDVRELDRWVDVQSRSRPLSAEDWLEKLDEDRGEGHQAVS